MVDPDRAHAKLALAPDFALVEFDHLDLKRARRGAQLVRDAALELPRPQRHRAGDEALGACGPEDALRPGAALMPA